jgi:hypothetical protein
MKIRFYSEQEQQEMLRLANDPSINVREASEKFARKYNRTVNSVEVKMYKIRRNLPSDIITALPVVKPSGVVKKQEPAEVGVEVPHGMTFEGTPKKILLYSDHFRIYF